MSVIRKELGALAALAALPAVMPAVAPAAAASAPAPTECATRVLSAEEMRAGVPSQITCYRTHAEMLTASGIRDGIRSPQGMPLLASHTVPGQPILNVYGNSCDGGGINVAAPYNDAITSTTHRLCGRIKHFVDANANGENQITMGASGATVGMNGALINRTTSIYYYST